MFRKLFGKRETLVIVGSAPLEEDLSNFIDACDRVVRFNNCKNYRVNSGEKTDILFMNNLGNPDSQRTLGFFLEKRTPQRIALELPYLSDTKKIYFTGPPARFIRKLLNSRPGEKTPLIEREIRNNAHDRNVGLEILDSINFPRDKAVFLSPDFYMAVWEKILGFGHTGAVLPSTGMLAIEYILHSREYAGYKVYITGFGHKGWKGHAWALEKKLFDQYIDEKKLLPVPGPENS